MGIPKPQHRPGIKFLIFSRPHLTFLILALPFSIASVFITPPLVVADETQHLLRSYSVANGDIFSHDTPTSVCHFPKAVAKSYDSYSASPRSSSALTVYWGESSSAAKDTRHSCGSAATYSFLMYLPQALGILISNILRVDFRTMIFIARLCNALFYCLALAYVIKKVRYGKWAFAAIGLLPLSIHYAASLSADPINNLVVLGFAAFVFNLYAQQRRVSHKQVIVLILFMALLALTKPSNLALLGLLPFLPASLFISNPKTLPSRLPNIHKWTTGIIGLFVALLAYSLNSVISVVNQSTYHFASHKLLSSPLFFAHVLWKTYLSPFSSSIYNSFVFNGIVGGFSSYAWQLPAIIIFLCMLTLFITFTYRGADERVVAQFPSWGLVIGSLLSFGLLIVLITYAMYTTWATLPGVLGPSATLAEGVQGRYFTAGLILLLPPLLLLGRHLQIRVRHDNTLGYFVFTSFLISLAFYTLNSIQYLHIY